MDGRQAIDHSMTSRESWRVGEGKQTRYEAGKKKQKFFLVHAVFLGLFAGLLRYKAVSWILDI